MNGLSGKRRMNDRSVVFASFQAWMSSAAFQHGHRQHSGEGPVSTHAELWQFDVVQHEDAPA